MIKMNGKDCLLDTNIVIGLFANESSQSSRKDGNRKRIEELAEASLILECDQDTARSYGKVKSQLKIKGTPIPENDIWIAALATQHQLT